MYRNHKERIKEIKIWPGFGFGYSDPSHEVEEIINIVKQVLPIFFAHKWIILLGCWLCVYSQTIAYELVEWAI